ncbi:tRNA (adenosine(37)-N6)-dimethylallyltransferase MiaA [Methyloraptor flagellatus]|uniref:tRNA dimethylallyltransferase n=1 Tax=Methyloraptor flagellatus TaxID=3162530 RepID=A0AAU7XBS0_9HYPH
MVGSERALTSRRASAWLGAVLIAGPTASGKSGLALALAERLGGTIVNADSMQVYRELRVLSARPSAEDEARAPHRLYGIVGSDDDWSVGHWLAAAGPAIAAIRAEGRLPIVVGGTGLYFNALTRGLVDLPEIPDAIRQHYREAPDLAALHAELMRRDPDLGVRLKPNDRARIARALEVIEATGRSLDAWRRETAGPALVDPAHAVRIVVAPERAVLHDRINRRFDLMIGEGALDEVVGLRAAAPRPGYGVTKAIGVAPLSAHLDGALSLDEAIERSKAETRQYAKRQETWFRNQMPDWTRVSGAPGDVEAVAALIAAQTVGS